MAWLAPQTTRQRRARAWSPFGLIILVMSVVGMAFPAAPAQADSTDLEPKISNHSLGAFQARPELQVAGSGQRTLQTGVLAAPARFTDMLLRWPALAPNTASVQLEVRVSADGVDWSPWGIVEPSDDLLEEADKGIAWSDPIYTGDARFYQLRVVLRPGAAGSLALDTASALSSLGSVQVHTVNAEQPGLPDPVPTTEAVMNASSVAPPPYVSRTRWGNPHKEAAPKAPPKFQRATHLVVHHTADANFLRRGEPNWAARVRAIWSFHAKSLGWGDIGYNWLIDPNGVIYAGRAGSTDPNRDAVGFHDASNYGSMGVAVLGTYTSVAPSRAAQDSLVRLLSWKARQRSIDPLGRSRYDGCARSRYCAPYNRGAVLSNITGHRQVVGGRTACPGDKFLEILPTIRQRVKESMSSATATATTTAAVNLRAGPGTNHRILLVVPSGAQVALHSGPHNGVWYEVSYRGTRGYIHGSYLRHNTATTTAAVNLRAGPGTNHRILLVVPSGARVTVHSGPHNGIWYEVTYNGTRGYIYGGYLRR